MADLQIGHSYFRSLISKKAGGNTTYSTALMQTLSYFFSASSASLRSLR